MGKKKFTSVPCDCGQIEGVGKPDLDTALSCGSVADLIFPCGQGLVRLDAGAQHLGIGIHVGSDGDVEAVSSRLAGDTAVGEKGEEGITTKTEHDSGPDGVDDVLRAEGQADVGADSPLALAELAEAEESEVRQEEVVGLESEPHLRARVLLETNHLGIPGQDRTVDDLAIAEVEVGDEKDSRVEAGKLLPGVALFLGHLVGGLVLLRLGETLQVFRFLLLDLLGRDDGQGGGGGDEDHRQGERDCFQGTRAHGSSFARCG